jgi:hypothetical protein
MSKKIVVCDCESCREKHDTIEEGGPGEYGSYCKPESKIVFKCSKCKMGFETEEEAKPSIHDCEGD